jgi:hypothetical protein
MKMPVWVAFCPFLAMIQDYAVAWLSEVKTTLYPAWMRLSSNFSPSKGNKLIVDLLAFGQLGHVLFRMGA